MRIAVVGSGPAGLLAAHCALQLGASEVKIFSNGGKSILYGAQYLHAPIPGITTHIPVALVDYQLKGSVEGYRAKVYGDSWDGRVSPDEYGNEEPHAAWDIRAAYSKLWVMYGNLVRSERCNSNWIFQNRRHDIVFWTAPATHLCQDLTHEFKSQMILARGDGTSSYDVERYAPHNTIMCSGRPEDRWYRISNILGHKTVEWSIRERIAGSVQVRKPLSTTCNCWPQIVRLGRYGAWRKGYLVHEVMADVAKAMG
jgi:hypothetical protein